MKDLLLLILMLSLFSCGEEALSPAIDCLGDVELSQVEACNNDLNEDKFCQLREVGKFVLSDKSKSFLPYFCMNTGDTIVFTNGVGNDLVFSMSDKKYYESHALVVQDITCETDSSKTSIDCIETEIASIALNSDKYNFEIEILTLPDKLEPLIGNVGDFLLIRREEVQGLFVEEWKSVLDQKTLSYDQESCISYFNTMELNGRVFENVYAFSDTEGCANYRYYINEFYGIVGFTRSDDVLWSLK